MSSPKKNTTSLYPEVILTNPEAESPPTTTTSSSSVSKLYPSVDIVKELAENLFPDAKDTDFSQPETIQQDAAPHEEQLIKIPGAVVHLIEKDQSIELASGDLTIVSIKQGDTTVAVLARLGEDKIQWPLAKDEAAVKLDESHYFFTLRVPNYEASSVVGGTDQEEVEMLNYGVTFAWKGQEALLKELDEVLERYSAFSVQEVKEIRGGKLEMLEEDSGAYWTVLAPNVEDYSSSVARLIASGSGQLIKGILWYGDVTVDGLKLGNEYFSKRVGKFEEKEISPAVMRRIKRVKKLTKMTENVATGILSGVVKVSGFFTVSIVNSKAGKKFFSLLPGEIVLASLDGFNKICDAVEVAGKNVMSKSSAVTTGLVSQRYGEQAAKATNEGLDAAGHAIGTAWAVFKIRKALNPKSVIKPTTLAKAAAEANSTATKAKAKK